MEHLEQLGILEKKLALLIECKKRDVQALADLKISLDESRNECECLRTEYEKCTKQLSAMQEELVSFAEENAQLKVQVEKLEDTLLTRHRSIEMLNEEKDLTKTAVEDLIKNIDALVDGVNGSEDELSQ